jgi:predicted  nucleic acid-binding Zn-ribbon protein
MSDQSAAKQLETIMMCDTGTITGLIAKKDEAIKKMSSDIISLANAFEAVQKENEELKKEIAALKLTESK